MVCIGLAKLKDVVTLMHVLGRTDVVFLPVANAAWNQLSGGISAGDAVQTPMCAWVGVDV